MTHQIESKQFNLPFQEEIPSNVLARASSTKSPNSAVGNASYTRIPDDSEIIARAHTLRDKVQAMLTAVLRSALPFRSRKINLEASSPYPL
ncbi:hypothetical protein TSAR_004621 [Trichomalopsis sarcophagae]|uniref:Uncharacterized protein n=1 Tax=Trichomalopsis sarcophagae TaxID=543379 RepID=A0A232EYJ2_9HYME|nr:hypothetical protein TSAR_004621 [Trichomalopsis sarcophagae]